MRRSLTSFGPGWLTLPASALVIVFFAFPVGGFLVRSLSDPVWGFQNYVAFLENPVYQRVLFNSLSISALCTLGCILIGYPVGLFGTLSGLIVAHAVLTVPYVVATVSGTLIMVDKRLEQAALTLGASPWKTFRRVTLPLILPAVLSGLVFAMVVSFDELVVSLFISTPAVRPVTVEMWSNVRGAVDPTIAAVATVLFTVSLAALLGEVITRRFRSRPEPSARR